MRRLSTSGPRPAPNIERVFAERSEWAERWRKGEARDGGGRGSARALVGRGKAAKAPPREGKKFGKKKIMSGREPSRGASMARSRAPSRGSFDFGDDAWTLFEILISYVLGAAHERYDVRLRPTALLLRSLCVDARKAFDACLDGQERPTCRIGGKDTICCHDDMRQKMSWVFSTCLFCARRAASIRLFGRPIQDADAAVLCCDRADCRPSMILQLNQSSAFAHESLGFVTTERYENRHFLHLALAQAKALALPVSRQVWKRLSSRRGEALRNTEVDLLLYHVDAGQITVRLNVPTRRMASIFGAVAGVAMPAKAIDWASLFDSIANFKYERCGVLWNLLQLGRKIAAKREAAGPRREGRRTMQLALRFPKKECRHDLQNLHSLMYCSNCGKKKLERLQVESVEAQLRLKRLRS